MTANATDNLKQFHIVDGPSREKLFDALKYSCSEDKRVVALSVLRFCLDGEVTLMDRGRANACHVVHDFDARIIGVTHNKKRDTQFIVEAYLGKRVSDERILVAKQTVKFMYDTISRTGEIMLPKRHAL